MGIVSTNGLISSQTFEKIKCIQLERWHSTKSDIERETIEVNPTAIFHQAMENCTPLLILQKVKRGGVIYQVSRASISVLPIIFLQLN